MMINRPIRDQSKKQYLCFYDINQDRKRTKLVNFLKKYGLRIQKSVFVVFLERGDKKRIIEFFQKIKGKEDKIGFAFACEECFRKIELFPKVKLRNYEII